MPEHTPAPTPSRSVYGFVLFLSAYSAFILYIIWAFVPDEILQIVGLTYLPQKYWAVALPIYFGVCLFIFLLIYPSLNMMQTPNLDDLRTVTDSHAFNIKDKRNCSSIPPVSDIPISNVCRLIYLHNTNSEER